MSAHGKPRKSRPRPLSLKWWVRAALVLGISGSPAGAKGEGQQFLFSGGLGIRTKVEGNPLLRGNGKLSGNHEADLRDLESDFRPSASRRLVSLSGQYVILNNPTWRLSLIRALARHERAQAQVESIHLEILRALISLVDAEAETSEDHPTQEDLERGALRHLARGTAAMGLARSRHPLALKKLLAMALSGDQVDPAGAHLALSALRSLPREVLRTNELSSLFSAKDIETIYRTESASSLDDLLGARGESLSPKTLVLAAHGSESAHRNPTNEITLADSPAEFPSFETLITLLLEEAELPRTFGHVKFWEEALKAEPVWTLRALGFLSARLEAPIVTWGKRTALARTRAQSKLERSEAAWCSVVLAPEYASELLGRDDPVITRAVLRQGSEGEVSAHVAAFLRRKALKGKAADLGLGIILQDQERWPEFSTAFLRSVEAQQGEAVLAALSSRLRTRGPGLGPDVEAMRNWLNEPSPEARRAVALGLSKASTGAAQGLLFGAYRRESDAPTRRALVASIFKTPLAKNHEFRELLTLDPDERCREYPNQREKPSMPGAHLSWSTRRTTKVGDSEGRILEVAPAPDGFVGIVRSSF